MNSNDKRRNEQRGRGWIARQINPDADVYRVRTIKATAAKRCVLRSTATESNEGPWTLTRYASSDDDHRCVYHARKSATQQLWFVVEAA